MAANLRPYQQSWPVYGLTNDPVKILGLDLIVSLSSTAIKLGGCVDLVLPPNSVTYPLTRSPTRSPTRTPLYLYLPYVYIASFSS